MKVETDNQGESESNTQVSNNTDNTSELGPSDGKASQKSQSVPQSVDRTEDSTLDNERVTVDRSDSENMIDNQNVVSSPEVSKPPEVKTSTPQTEDGRGRERHDSRLSIEEEEAEFEEDKIMGKLGDDKCHSLFSLFILSVSFTYFFVYSLVRLVNCVLLVIIRSYFVSPLDFGRSLYFEGNSSTVVL